MRTGVLCVLTALLGSVKASGSTPPEFIKASGTQFTLDGEPFRFIGTNAYWLQLLNKKDLNQTLYDISATGIKVVRAWAFNDVEEIPEKGVWFQVFHKNGTIELNTGENGLARLDNIVKAAKDNKLRVVFSLTNNWSRHAAEPSSHEHKDSHKRNNDCFAKPLERPDEPRNLLSNDYGGMDVYTKHFNKDNDLFHDEFYTDDDIVAAYSSYVATIVKRYANEPSVLGWELANDPRCSSSLPASKSCTPQTITKWAATIAKVVKDNDPNHLVSVGAGGFYCTGCPKLFPLESHHDTKRSLGNAPRNNDKPNPFFDGSFGIDSEDLANAPGIDFSTLQYFPDQNAFGPNGEIDITDPNSIAKSGVDMVKLLSETGKTFGKPVVVSGFGVLTCKSRDTFSPFNPNDGDKAFYFCTTEEEQAFIMDAVYNAGFDGGVNVQEYQWGQDGLNTDLSGPARRQVDYSLSKSPNDGYSISSGTPARSSTTTATTR